jgi:ATP-dependent helicase HrpA
LVPGLREEQIRVLLRALPKTLRRQLHPLEPKVREVADGFVPGDGTFLDALAGYLTARYGVRLRAADWPDGSLPDYLRPRIEVHDRRNRAVAAGRDLSAVRGMVAQTPLESDAWKSARATWRRGPLDGGNWDALPESVVVERVTGLDVLGYPGLRREGDDVFTDLFSSAADRETAGAEAVRVLLGRLLARDLAWAGREAGKFHTAAAKPAARGLGEALAAWSATPVARGDADALRSAVIRHLEVRCLHLDPLLPLRADRVRERAEEVRKSLPSLLAELREIFQRVSAQRDSLLAVRGRYPGFLEDLQRLAPEDFFAVTPPGQLRHLPRFLRAMQIRAERAAANPARDAEKARQLTPFLGVTLPPAQRETFRWLLEEFRVSLFAQELGTAEPVSTARLQALREASGGQ